MVGFLKKMFGDSKQESSINLARRTEDEARRHQLAQRSFMDNMQTISPWERDAQIMQRADSLFQPQAAKINEMMRSAMGVNARSAGGRGMLGSSKALATDRTTARGAASDLAQAYANSLMQGEDSFFRQQADRRADLGSAMASLGQDYSQRLARSTRTTSAGGGEGWNLLGTAGGIAAGKWLG